MLKREDEVNEKGHKNGRKSLINEEGTPNFPASF